MRKGSRGVLQFEEVCLGTAYNTLRHLAVGSIRSCMVNLGSELEAIKEMDEKPIDAKWDAHSNPDTLVGSRHSSLSSSSKSNARSRKVHIETDKSPPVSALSAILALKSS